MILLHKSWVADMNVFGNSLWISFNAVINHVLSFSSILFISCSQRITVKYHIFIFRFVWRKHPVKHNQIGTVDSKNCLIYCIYTWVYVCVVLYPGGLKIQYQYLDSRWLNWPSKFTNSSSNPSDQKVSMQYEGFFFLKGQLQIYHFSSSVIKGHIT